MSLNDLALSGAAPFCGADEARHYIKEASSMFLALARYSVQRE
jgi:hypothetical protein